MEADFPDEQTSPAPPPPEDEAGFENIPHSITEPEIKQADFYPLAPAENSSVVVQATLAELELVCEAAPAFTHEDVSVRCWIPGETDIFASLESSFVLVVPGTFLMGSPDFELGRSSDETIHEVTLAKAFHMQNTPVTQGLWKAVMGTDPASFKDGWEDLPVVGISWNECREFLRRLNSTLDSKYRLPTEAEWEYGCRAGSAAAFATGDISELYCGRDPILWETGWYCGNSGRKRRPVAQKSPNAWQLFDMHGNVSEWCEDWYADYPEEPCTDPCGPMSGSGKVVRGGSWFSSAKNCRSAARYHWPPNSKSDSIGFRLVREPS